MLIKGLLYLTIILCGITSAITGWNKGFDKGRLMGQDECITKEITRGNVKCNYIKQECKKSCPIDMEL